MAHHGLDHLIGQERRRDAARLIAYEDEVRRGQGVCWSGLAPLPPRLRSDHRIEADARRRLGALNAFRASAAGGFLAALGRAQAAAAAVQLGGESARAAVGRNAANVLEQAHQAAALFEAQARALTEAAAQARQAIAHSQAEQESAGGC